MPTFCKKCVTTLFYPADLPDTTYFICPVCGHSTVYARYPVEDPLPTEPLEFDDGPETV